MGALEILLISVGLAMDAFAVSVCKGLAMKKMEFKKAVIIGAWFGGFQILMPTIGFFLGKTFESFITCIDHWIAFALLGIIGGNMIKEALSKDEESQSDKTDFYFHILHKLIVLLLFHIRSSLYILLLVKCLLLHFSIPIHHFLYELF